MSVFVDRDVRHIDRGLVRVAAKEGGGDPGWSDSHNSSKKHTKTQFVLALSQNAGSAAAENER